MPFQPKLSPTSHLSAQSVHKALEQELRPIKPLVHISSDEERFGLRSVTWCCTHSFLTPHSIVQLIDGFIQLMTDGITVSVSPFCSSSSHRPTRGSCPFL